MIKYLRICCPNCRRRLKVRLEYIKLQVVCNHCHEPFVAEPVDEDPADSPLRFPIDAPLLEACRLPVSPPSPFHEAPGSPDSHGPGVESSVPERAEPRETLSEGAGAIEGRFPSLETGARAPHTEFDDLRYVVDSLQVDTEALRFEAGHLKDEQPASASELARLTAALSRLESEAQRARAERDEAQSLVETLRAELGQARRKAEDAEAEQCRLRAEAERLRTQLGALGPVQNSEFESEPACNREASPLSAPREEPPAHDGRGLAATLVPADSFERPPLEVDPLDSVDRQFLALKNQLWEIHQAERKQKAQTALIDRLNRIWRQSSPQG